MKTKLNSLINSVWFWLRSITKKVKHGNYSVAVHSGKYNTCYMKVHIEKYSTWYRKTIWRIQYRFAHAEIIWLKGWYLSRFTRYCTLNISYRNRKHIFCLIVLQTLILSLIHVASIQGILGKSYVEMFYE